MIVKCVKKPNIDSALKVGREYLVFEIGFGISEKETNHVVAIRSDDEGGPSWFDLMYFDIVDTKIPIKWKIKYFEETYRYYISPINDYQGDLWEGYYDSDPDAERIFEEVYRDIQRFHGIEVPDPEPEKKPENPFDWSDKWLRDE